jgi:hypothetical protein
LINSHTGTFINTEYIHDKLGQPIDSIAGHYTSTKELRLVYNGREILCILGSAAIESSHYRFGNCAYALVPGYIVKWKFKENDSIMPVSEIEPIRDEETKNGISAAINKIEPVTIINFW